MGTEQVSMDFISYTQDWDKEDIQINIKHMSVPLAKE